MFDFKNSKDGRSVEVFCYGKSIGWLERSKDPIAEKYFEKSKYSYLVTDPVTEKKELFSSRQDAAYRLKSLTDYYDRDENRIREKFEAVLKVFVGLENPPEPDENDEDLDLLAYECAMKIKELKEEFIKQAIEKSKEN